MLAVDLSYSSQLHDVNNDSAVSPLDALLVINEINSPQHSGPDGRFTDHTSGLRLDVNGDQYVTPQDALLVINYLNQDDSESASRVQRAAPINAVQADTNEIELFSRGGESLVNTTTKRAQLHPAADASEVGGQLVVVWGSDDNGGRGVFGQRFDLDGQRLGGEFLVNATETGSQATPDVSVASDGSFVVVWSDNSSDQNGWDVFGQRFAADGTPLSTTWRVNQTVSGNQRYPAIAHTANDGFVVTWEGSGPGDSNGVFYRTFEVDGLPKQDESIANEFSSGFQGAPSIEATFHGGFAIAWEGQSNTDNHGIQLRAFDSAANPLGDPIHVNGTTQAVQQRPVIATREDGQIAVAWQSSTGDENGTGILVQRFDEHGQHVGGQILANETTDDNQEHPSIEYLRDGGFALTWNGKGQGDVQGVFVRTFSDMGLATTGESLVNETTQSNQEDSTIIAAGHNAFIVWQGRGVGDTDGVYSRLYGVVPSIVEIPFQTINEVTLFQLSIAATGDVLFSLDQNSLSLGAAIDEITGLFEWTPSEEQGPGEYDVHITVSDRLDPEQKDHATFTITVLEVNSAPTLILPSAVLSQTTVLRDGETLAFTAQASDADIPANQLRFSLGIDSPEGVNLDEVTGQFSWTPTPDQIGLSNVTIIVSDNGTPVLTDIATIQVEVIPSNEPPLVADIENAEIDEETTLAFTIAASDPEGNSLSYSLADGSPEGASIDSGSGQFSWTPSELQGTGEYPMTVIVTDDATPPGSTTASFTVVVNEVNRAPQIELPDAITQQAVQLEVGQELTFAATATDPDIPVNGLTYELFGDVPIGAVINPDTGEFAWTPTSQQDRRRFTIGVRVVDDGSPTLSDSETFQVVVGGCAFDTEFAHWNINESGGTSTGGGKVTASGCTALMTEGDSFVTTLETSFVVPALADTLSVSFAGLNFDETDTDFINDAFEMALVDQDGNALAAAFAPDRDAFFNTTESLPAAVGTDASLNGSTVIVDLSDIEPGTAATLILRLVNNDSDPQTQVTITDFSIPGFGDIPVSVEPEPLSLLSETRFTTQTTGSIGQVDDGITAESTNEYLAIAVASPYASLPAGTEVALSGRVETVGSDAGDRSIVQVMVNGAAVSTHDAGDNFLHQCQYPTW